ncbi:PEGA domain-containing protein (plasmid) [Aeromonas media]|uniref:PEGA domain-containing protein n=1 Tax=Aeromonas caviae TaxID=648 RepID=A0A7D5YII7_AERCA|nr:PEGA domain-containing protein [Aeromonas caviae]QLI60491.1 PEGA domain-containing protein [Aeromonas caviae]QYK83536.1 PEGA domain-containing protein [Aeromonas media]
MKHIALALMMALVGGCATVVDGTSQQVSFTSSPAGASVYKVNGDLLGITPFTAELERDGDKQYVARKEGYAPQVVKLAYRKNGTTHANAVSPFTFVVADAVDVISGAQLELAPQVDFTMAPKAE